MSERRFVLPARLSGRAPRRRRLGFTTLVCAASALAVLLSGTGAPTFPAALAALELPEHRTPQEAPEQPWGTAAGRPSRVPNATPNTAIPKTMRTRYPIRRTRGATTINKAEVKPAPAAEPTGYEAGRSTELVSGRSRFQRVYANPDGSSTTEFSATPLNFRATDGSWKRVDPTLRRNGSGWRNGADEVAVSLAGQGHDARLAAVSLPGGRSVVFGLSGGAAVAGRADGGAVAYPGVLRHADLRFEAVPGGLKESIVLRDAAAPRAFTFPLQLGGLSPVVAPDGAVSLRDGGGAERARIPAGFMTDAAAPPVRSEAVRYRLQRQGSAWALRVELDAAWLADPARAYPVVVDPTVETVNSESSSALNYTDNGRTDGGQELSVGKKSGVRSAAYLKFPGVSTTLARHTVYGAQLGFVGYAAPSCKPRTVAVHAVTAAWPTSSLTTYPGPSTGPALGSVSFASGYVALGASATKCAPAMSLVDLGAAGRDLLQGWADGTTANYGLSLRASDSDGLAWKTIAGPGTANPPALFVTHSPNNAAYAIPNPVPNPIVTKAQAGKVKVVVTNRSADTWTASTHKLVYRLYDKAGRKIGQYDAAALPGAVARGAKVTLDASIGATPVGVYIVDFSVARIGGVVFSDDLVPPARIVLQIIDLPPVLQELYPPNGYQAPSLTPQLWARAVDLDATPGSSMSYQFELCDSTSGNAPTNCSTSAWSTSPAWVPPAGRLSWNKTYFWRALVKDGTTTVPAPAYAALLTAVPQPPITSSLSNAAGAQKNEFEPQVGNYTTAAVDGPVASVGPDLQIIRSYNSLDPRRSAAFGAGWTTRYDTRLVPDGDGSGNVTITYPDGQQARFGKNPDGTYVAPQGRTATLSWDATALTWTLRDSSGAYYVFASTGKLIRVRVGWSKDQTLTYGGADGNLITVQNLDSGRKLTLTWANGHVATVSTDPVDGVTYTWTYTYQGDLLTKVCAPDGGCTNYTYAAGSHYRSAVLDARPESYYRFSEDSGSDAGSEMSVNLGKDVGTYTSPALNATGALAGTSDTAATFNGSSSFVKLPNGLVKKSRDVAVELWFRTSGTGAPQPLLGYQSNALASTSPAGVPLLYVGSDGLLYGQFWTGTVQPMKSSATVNNGAWHHAVLSSSGSTQTLYLDGKAVGTPLTGSVINHTLLSNNQVGAAYAAATTWPGYGSTARRFFNGSIDEVAVYAHPLGAEAVAAHYTLGTRAADQVASVVMPSGKVATTQVYDPANDRLKEYTDRNGGTWKLGLPTVVGGDTDLRRDVIVRDPLDRRYLYDYDALNGRLVRTGTPNGTTGSGDSVTDGMALRTMEYDANGFLAKVTNEVSATVTMTNDDRGNVLSRTTCRAVGSGCSTAYWTFPTTLSDPFDPRRSLPLEARDARSAGATDNTYRTTYTYNSKGDLTVQTFPNGTYVKNDYTVGGETAVGGGAVPAGLVKSTTDQRGKVTTYGYFKTGDLAELREPTGTLTRYSYDALGRRTSATDVSTAHPDGITTSYGYDKLSNVVSETGPVTTDAVTGVQHQIRTARTYGPDGTIDRIEIGDLRGNDTTRVTTSVYDDHNRVITQTDPEGNETDYGYDQFGNQAFVVDPNGNRFEFTYNARNQQLTAALRDFDGDPAGAPALPDGVLVMQSNAYDDAGRLARRTDSMGRTTQFDYYADDLLAKATLKGFHNPDGTTRDYVAFEKVYDAAGNVTTEKAANGLSVTNTQYDAMNRAFYTEQKPKSTVMRSVTSTYNTYGDLLKTVASGTTSNVTWSPPVTGAVTEYEYDAFGRNTATKVWKNSTDRIVTQLDYNDQDQVVAQVDPRGYGTTGDARTGWSTTYAYDELGRQVSVTGPQVSAESGGAAATPVRPTSTVGYNTFGEQVEARDPLGNVTRTTYNGIGKPAAVSSPAYTPPGSSTPVVPGVRYSYDGLGNVVRTEAMNGTEVAATTKLVYDRLQRLITRDSPGTTDDDRQVTHLEYDRTGNQLAMVEPGGARAQATYDDLDRRVTSTDIERYPVADALTTKYTFNDLGLVTSTLSPGGDVTNSVYDDLGQLIRAQDAAGTVTNFGYDYAGRQIRQRDPVGRSRRTDYDYAGRVSSNADLNASDAVLRSQSYQYDDAGNVLVSTPAGGHATRYAYDAASRLVEQVEPVADGHDITTSVGYDAAGNRTRFTDGRGNSTIYTVNSLGLPESTIEPATTAYPAAADRTWTTVYNGLAQAVSLRAPGGVSRTRTFDAAGRLTTESGAGGESSTMTRTLTYDLNGRVRTMSAPGGTNSYTYDDRDDLLTAQGPSGNASLTFDEDGEQTSQTDAAGTSIFTYDKGRLATVTDGVTQTRTTYGYDAANLLKTVDYGSGRVRTFGYDDYGHLRTDVLTNSGGTTVNSITYGYDNDDHMTSKVTTGVAGASSNTYGYDWAGRLTSWVRDGTTTGYGWDDSGNRTSVTTAAGSTTATFDQRNRLVSDSAGAAYTYSARGTMASETHGSDVQTYTFDAFDRLIGQGSQTYTYDALDRLISAGTRTFGYAGSDDEPVSDGTQTFSRGPDQQLLAIGQSNGSSSTKRLTIADQHGDVVGGFDPASTALPALADSRTYDPWGQVLASTGVSYDLGFQGEWTDPTTGRIDMGARWYDPATGRFQSRDKVTYAGGASAFANTYTYAADDPMSRVDPDGNWSLSSIGSGLMDIGRSAVSAVQSTYSWATRQVSNVSYYAAMAASGLMSAGRFLSRQYDHVVSTGTRMVNNLTRQTRNFVHDVHTSVDSIRSDPGGWARRQAQVVQQQVHRAMEVTRKAQTYLQQKVKQYKLEPLVAAFKPLLTTVKVVTTATAILAPMVVSMTKNVIADIPKNVQAVLDTAQKVNGAIVQGVSTAVNAVSEATNSAASWVYNNPDVVAEIAVGVAVGIAVGAACVGTAGAACVIAGAVLSGAAGSMAGFGVKAATGKEPFSWSGLGESALIGGATGLLTLGLGKGASAVLRPIAGKVAGTAAGQAVSAAGKKAGGAIKKLFTSCANSFDANTRVVLADGSLKAIGALRAGDKVKAADPRTGRYVGPRSVTAVKSQMHNGDLTDVAVIGQNGRSAKIRTTRTHPFFDRTRLGWLAAGALVFGHSLAGIGPAEAMVGDVSARSGQQEMYNLTVDELHTYYVQAGDTPVLVHNCGDEMVRMYVPGRPGVDTTPQARITEGAWRTQGGGLERGSHVFVVMPNWEVRSIRQLVDDAMVNDAGHTSLSGRTPVIAAGEFEVNGEGAITEYSNFSGHYHPLPESKWVIDKALGESGYDLGGASWKHWTPPGAR